jgi:pyruvate dehydrogenase E1 component alpha subunit
MTYRWYDHSGFSGAKAGADGAFGLPYRSDDETRQWMTKDPIVRYKNFLIDRKIATAEEIAALDKETQATVDATWVKARTEPKATGPMGLKNTWKDIDVEATQFFDRKDFATTAWVEPAYLAENYKRLVLEA